MGYSSWVSKNWDFWCWSSWSFGHFDSEFQETVFNVALVYWSRLAKGYYTSHRALVFSAPNFGTVYDNSGHALPFSLNYARSSAHINLFNICGHAFSAKASFIIYAVIIHSAFLQWTFLFFDQLWATYPSCALQQEQFAHTTSKFVSSVSYCVIQYHEG